MNGAITTIDALQSWFITSQKPFWTLRYFKPGAAGEVIARNKTEDDLTRSFELLRANVMSQAANNRALLQAFVYDQGKENNYTAITNLDIQPAGQMLPGHASIAGIPGGSWDDMLKKEKVNWELEYKVRELEAAIENPPDDSERIVTMIERFSATPIGSAIVARILGVPINIPANEVPVTGLPGNENESDTFDDDLDAVTGALQVSDTVLMSKLRRLVESQPDVAKNILNSI
ncbi:MAG: hypothetical protein R3A50_04810 [Saprospiraceae bacterium]